jgi:ankyrin repeat protein
MLACTKDNREMVEILVGYGASLALKNKDGWNSFHIACREGHPNIVQFLLDTDSVCWETVSKNGRTPLHSAGERGEREREIFDIFVLLSLHITALHGMLETLSILHTRYDW